MQLYDLNIQILDSIFTANINKDTLAQYMEWHQNLDPSFKCLKHMLGEYLAATDSKMLKISAQIILQLFQKFNQFRFPRTFVRAFLSIMQEHLKALGEIIKVEELAKNWKIVSIDLLQCYLTSFGIHLEGTSKSIEGSVVISLPEYFPNNKRIEAQVSEYIELKDYESAIKLIKMINYPSAHLEVLFASMANNKLASKAANFMKSHGIDSTLYPQINKRLSKSMIRYFLMNVGWDAAEEIFSEQPDALWNLIEDLLQKKKERQAQSVWLRNKDSLSESTAIGEELRSIASEWRNKELQLSKDIIPNPYFQDYFGPIDREKYLTLEELGITQNQVFMLKDNSELVDRFVESIRHAKICAIDTESIVGKTKLDKKKEESPSIIQVALEKEVFIIDCFEKNERVKQAFLEYLSSDRLLLGHALENDLDGVLLGFGLNSQERKVFKFGNVIDICKLFKAINPSERHSNLSHISQKVLGRQICKKQTLTNWARRPLRRSQIHYAAMDALCVMHIYHKLELQIGPNMLAYYLQEI